MSRGRGCRQLNCCINCQRDRIIDNIITAAYTFPREYYNYQGKPAKNTKAAFPILHIERPCRSDSADKWRKIDQHTLDYCLSKLKQKGISERQISGLTGLKKDVVVRA